ncbi:MAG TPA: cytochrome b/b6 domain-containing protein [Armatimonadota bacterium]|jgi:cytochrome b subunit of formate dehydrogenase
MAIGKSVSRATAAVYGLVACLGLCGLVAPSVFGQQSGGAPAPAPAAKGGIDCMSCHVAAMTDHTPAVNAEALKSSPHKDSACQDCHFAITAVPHTPAMLKAKANCATCHTDEAAAYATSVHSRPDKVAGDHPTCITCHGKGDPHAVTFARKWGRADKAALCSTCHADKAKMGRYGVDPDAVSSYHESFHGKALLRFHMGKAATCTDCHRAHDVLAPSDPHSPTNRLHAAATCGQAGCHPGAMVNFAMSGANHLRLKVKESIVLRLEEAFFKWLTLGTIVFLLAGVALDLRRKVLAKGAQPRSGRAVGLLVSTSFFVLVASLAMAYVGARHSGAVAGVAIAIMAIAFIVHFATRKRLTADPNERTYKRISTEQRIQHICLAISFTLLVLSGMPLRYPNIPLLHSLYVGIGGIGVWRIVHRVAACVMIFTWIWHTIFLLRMGAKTGFKLSGWTMLPNLRDVKDFVAVSKYYLGLTNTEPRYDRFQFREKFDYFAVYWGMPIMVFSGLVLWFPMQLANRLPEIGLSVAYIAHSDEAVLAFLAIVTWHLYNVHFNPDAFPMSATWLTGEKTRSEMEREHPLELKRLDGEE